MKRSLTYLFLTLLSVVALVAAPKVSLLTFYPGSEIYELEGHTALRVVDDRGDVTYNWGTFDFNTPGFVYRYVKGETDYMVAGIPTQPYLDYYASTGRRVVEQDLALDEAQTARLIALIDQNMLPENRVYRYNYVLDNCATRPLQLIETASGDSLRMKPYRGVGSTFRQAMRHYHVNYPWYQFGIDLALGSGIDRPVTDRQKAFAPMDLLQMSQLMSVSDGNGHFIPLVSDTRVLVKGLPGGASADPTPWWLAPLFWSWVVFGIVTLVSWRDFSRRRCSRWLDTLLFGLFGIVGLLLTFLIFVSVHEATSPNWLYLWLNPMCLFIAVGIWIKKCKRAVYWWQIVNFALVLILGLLGAYGVQRLNAAFWPLMMSDIMRSLISIYSYRCNVNPHRLSV